MNPLRQRSRRFLGAIAPYSDRILPIWFLLWSGLRLYQRSWDGVRWDTTFVGADFRIYRASALALLEGRDPWSAFVRWNGLDWHFAALPTAAQLFVPFALIPEGLAIAIFTILSAIVAWLAIRRLGLPSWFLLFPPIMEGLYVANPQILLFGLLIVGGPIARAVATGLKVYAIVPSLARREWRGIAATLALFVMSVALGVGLWSTYLADFGAIASRIVQESQGGVSAALLLNPDLYAAAVPSDGVARLVPGVLLYGLVAMLLLVAALRDVRAAGWLAVPLLLPAAEYYLATMAIPAARRLSIWVIAIATPPTYLLGLILLAYEIASGRKAMVDGPAPQGLVSWLRAFRQRTDLADQLPGPVATAAFAGSRLPPAS